MGVGPVGGTGGVEPPVRSTAGRSSDNLTQYAAGADAETKKGLQDIGATKIAAESRDVKLSDLLLGD